MRNYKDIHAFYTDRGGRHSPECDFGGFHHHETEADRPRHLRARWRVSVVAVTGDVYAVSYRTDRVCLLGRLAGGPYGTTDRTGKVSLSTRNYRPRAYAAADRAFADWAQQVGRPLGWFERRLEEFNGSTGQDELK